MYLYEKLEQFCLAEYGTTNAVLAAYFVNRTDERRNAGIKNVCLDTGLSKSSVIRFCQMAGFDGFFEFMDSLRHELDLIGHETVSGRLRGKDAGELADMTWYPDLVSLLKKKKRVIIYGRRTYLEPFWPLIRQLRRKAEVINASPLSKEETEAIHRSQDEQTLVWIIEPEQTWLSLKDYARISPELPDNYPGGVSDTVLISRKGNITKGINADLPSQWGPEKVLKELSRLSRRLCWDLQEPQS